MPRRLINFGVVNSRNGAGVGSALLDGTWRGGTQVTVSGLEGVTAKIHLARPNATGILVRLRDVSSSDDATIAAATRLFQSTPQDNGAGFAATTHTFTTVTDDSLWCLLRGAVEKIDVEVSATGGGLAAGDLVIVELSGVEDL